VARSQVPNGGKLQRRTTSDRVADELREAIVRGDYEDGAELNQVDLARDFGVSRVPIREALRQLKAEGLISSESYMRAVVVGHTLERVVEILELRMLLETYLLNRAVPRITPADLDELRELCQKMTQTHPHDEWLALNTAFHDRLNSFADAPIARDLANQMAHRVQRYVRMVRSSGLKRLGDPNEEHLAIVEALARRDAAAAGIELQNHLQHTAVQVKRVFEDSGKGGSTPSDDESS
jgi:DNA-binding GntR family transcriptional regulator